MILIKYLLNSFESFKEERWLIIFRFKLAHIIKAVLGRIWKKGSINLENWVGFAHLQTMHELIKPIIFQSVTAVSKYLP